jgi:sugar O-acyltransferase (sialic acid O-acetyltransferase NeuD family)
MGNKIFILGAGGFAREVLDILSDLDRIEDVLGFLEENCQREGELINEKPVYDLSKLNEFNGENVRLVCAIGTPLRKNVIEKTKQMGFKYETLIHSSAILSEWVELGEGCIICAGTILTSQINIGNFVILNLACTIGHDVIIEDYTTLSPGTHISGKVTIGKECFIGTGTVTVEKLKIGNNSFIGAGAVVSKDLPNNVLALGTPAKVLRELELNDWKLLL